MRKYRQDTSSVQEDGAVRWYAKWLYGPALSAIENCRIESLAGDMRANVYITSEPDSAFSQPAVCSIKGRRVKGYVASGDDCGDNLVFRHLAAKES